MNTTIEIIRAKQQAKLAAEALEKAKAAARIEAETRVLAPLRAMVDDVLEEPAFPRGGSKCKVRDHIITLGNTTISFWKTYGGNTGYVYRANEDGTIEFSYDSNKVERLTVEDAKEKLIEQLSLLLLPIVEQQPKK